MLQNSLPCRQALSDAEILKILNGAGTGTLERVLELAARTVNAGQAFILRDDQTEQSIGGTSVATSALREWLASSETTAVIPDVRRFTGPPGAARALTRIGARFFAAGKRGPGGCLCVYSLEPRTSLSEAERASLEALADVVSALAAMRLLAGEAMHQRMQAGESERRFRSVADDAPLPVWMTGSDGCTEYANRACCQVTGAGADATGFEDWIAAVHPEDRERFRSAWRAATTEGKPFALEYRVLDPAGPRWVLGHGVPRFLANGAFSGYVGWCTGSTRRQEPEQEFESEPNLLVVTGPEGCIERWNGAAAVALGVSGDDLPGTALRTLCAGFQEAFEATFQDVCRTGAEKKLRACLSLPGRERRWYEWTVRPMSDGTRTAGSMICTARGL
ncbi:MAG TPA: PAS domain-containing protein [Bryobacteraceae bacterium]